MIREISMKISMKKVVALLVLAAAGAMSVGCNTIHGLGKDVEKVGEKMQEKSASK